MLILSGTRTPTTDAVDAAVSGVFVEPYQVTITPSWMTESAVTDKTATTFLVTFTFPAPAGATFDYLVSMPDGAATPSPLVLSGTVALSAGSDNATVSRALVLPYQVTISPSWMTDSFVSLKTATEFLVTFNFPAPTGASFDYIVSLPEAAAAIPPTTRRGHGSNRLTRDEILLRALDMVDSPSLDQKARPLGSIDPQSYVIGWLQEGLDYFQRKIPWSGLLASTPFTLAGTDLYDLPADFVLDLRDGLRIPSIRRRLERRSLTWLLDMDTEASRLGTPEAYVVLPPSIRIYPHPDKAYTAEFWYYTLPATLTASTIPDFPDDWVLIEFVRLRGKEWTGESAPGTAIAFGAAMCADLIKSGLGNTADSDALQMDRHFFRPTGSGGYDRNAWMGTR